MNNIQNSNRDTSAIWENVTTETRLRIALAQYLGDGDPAVIIEQAKRASADIVVFPEMFSNGYLRFDATDSAAVERWRKGAETPDGPFVERFRNAAKMHKVSVVATFLESSDPKPFNSALLIDSNGQTVLHHRKVHIGDFDSPECACGKGKDFRVAEVQASAGPVKIGLMICMDREYPEAARLLSRAGAEVALVPNCCELASDPTVGDVRIAQARGRAFETVMGIAVANYPAPRSDGHSFAVDALGKVIVMGDDSAGLVIAGFDLAQIRRARIEDHFRWRI
jgi:deaminated glutathione amidase